MRIIEALVRNAKFNLRIRDRLHPHCHTGRLKGVRNDCTATLVFAETQYRKKTDSLQNRSGYAPTFHDSFELVLVDGNVYQLKGIKNTAPEIKIVSDLCSIVSLPVSCVLSNSSALHGTYRCDRNYSHLPGHPPWLVRGGGSPLPSLDTNSNVVNDRRAHFMLVCICSTLGDEQKQR